MTEQNKSQQRLKVKIDFKNSINATILSFKKRYNCKHLEIVLERVVNIFICKSSSCVGRDYCDLISLMFRKY